MAPGADVPGAATEVVIAAETAAAATIGTGIGTETNGKGPAVDAGLFFHIMQHVNVRIVGKEAFLPTYQSDLAAGADLSADLPEPLTLAPLERALVPTGIRIELPEGYEAQVRPRSGLAAKQGVTLLNAPGTIDADYRGEVKAILVNLSNQPVTIEPGMRIAQLVVAPVTHVTFTPVAELQESRRGEGGFGSTGR